LAADAARPAASATPDSDGVSRFQGGHLRPGGLDVTSVLVAKGEREFPRRRQGKLPAAYVHVGVTNAATADSNQYLVPANLGNGNVIDAERVTWNVESRRFHRLPPC
jgi:hypothetical protein